MHYLVSEAFLTLEIAHLISFSDTCCLRDDFSFIKKLQGFQKTKGDYLVTKNCND